MANTIDSQPHRTAKAEATNRNLGPGCTITRAPSTETSENWRRKGPDRYGQPGFLCNYSLGERLFLSLQDHLGQAGVLPTGQGAAHGWQPARSRTEQNRHRTGQSRPSARTRRAGPSLTPGTRADGTKAPKPHGRANQYGWRKSEPKSVRVERAPGARRRGGGELQRRREPGRDPQHPANLRQPHRGGRVRTAAGTPFWPGTRTGSPTTGNTLDVEAFPGYKGTWIQLRLKNGAGPSPGRQASTQRPCSTSRASRSPR